MKTLKTLAAAFLIVLSTSAFASDETANYKLQMDYALQTYINAITKGKINGLEAIMDQDLKYTFTKGEKILNYGKSDLIAHLKSTEDIVQNCTTETTILEQDPTQTIVKVTLKYDSFSRINYLNIANTTKGWKITNITNTFISGY